MIWKSPVQLCLLELPLEVVPTIRNIGICNSADLKPSTHSSYITSKAYSRCAVLLKGFHTSDASTIVYAFEIFIPPIQYCWSPWLLKDIKCIEGVQLFFTHSHFRRIRCPITDYGNRLASLQLDSLELIS